MREKFFVTTPIYYVNDVPHIGHAYTTIAADILARYNRLKGKEVFFLTGTDEHGQKVEKAASERNKSPKEHSDIMVENFKNLWKKLNVSNNAFIRTTDECHKNIVQDILQKLYKDGEIVKRKYSGYYCTPDERFWTEKEVIEGKCPDCKRPVENIEEENYFFLMSQYQDKLIQYVENNSSYVLPETRKNEVLGFLKNNPLGDLCISRPKHRLSWGVELPFDKNFVTYVWFDALVNYYSATKYLAPEPETTEWWPANHHLVGKDILITHAVYWSTMLMALGMKLPENLFAHGWWTVEGKKMSKSVGNVVDPNEIIDKYGADAFRYFLFREVPFGLDGDFSEQALINRINTDLANNLGNLLSRSISMIEKYRNGEIPKPINSKDRDSEKRIQGRFVQSSRNAFCGLIEQLQFSDALAYLWVIIDEVNQYIQYSAPWQEKDEGALSNTLYHLAESLRLIAVYVYPFMPLTGTEIWKQLGIINQEIQKFISEKPEAIEWGGYRILSGTKTQKGRHLFQRIETKEAKK